jgi:hypothetical protein
MRTSRCARVLPLLPLIFAVARVQATQNALVTGQVLRKRDHLPFPGVKVTLLNPSIGFSQSGETNSFGNYGFLSVPPQPGYILTAQIGDGAPSTREFDVAIADQKLVLPPIELEDAGTGLQLLAKSPTTGTSGPASTHLPKRPGSTTAGAAKQPPVRGSTRPGTAPTPAPPEVAAPQSHHRPSCLHPPPLRRLPPRLKLARFRHRRSHQHPGKNALANPKQQSR